MIGTFYYVDLANGDYPESWRKCADSGWIDSSEVILSTLVDSFRAHNPDVPLVMFTDEVTKPFRDIPVFRVPVNGMGLMEHRLCCIGCFGHWFKPFEPFFHFDADVGFYGPLTELIPKGIAYDVVTAGREEIIYAPMPKDHQIPDVFLDPKNPGFARLDLLFPYLVGFIYVASPAYTDKIFKYVGALKNSGMENWWGDLLIHNRACRELRHIVFSKELVGSGKYATQIGVFQKGIKTKESVAAFAKAVKSGVRIPTTIVMDEK